VSGEAFSAKGREATIGSDDATATSSSAWRRATGREATPAKQKPRRCDVGASETGRTPARRATFKDGTAKALRGPGESYSAVILRLAKGDGGMRRRPAKQKPRRPMRWPEPRLAPFQRLGTRTGRFGEVYFNRLQEVDTSAGPMKSKSKGPDSEGVIS
jgi:hypothetical protein